MLDPDARFLLANERTMLAWIRTALTLIAGGVALNFLSDGSEARIVGVLVILLGGITSVIGYMRYMSADKAIRAGKLPDNGHGLKIQVIGVVVFCIAIIVLEFTRT